ncbi:MAG: PD40 domain-containing protein [Elusimicrobia bacterium]|nr:PD40 domain-containing protein [Elusimicrobiota bacterium]
MEKDFNWKIISTEHFDIYHYDASEKLVPYAAVYLEEAYRTLTEELHYPLEGRTPFFLFADHSEFEQNNVVTVGDGTGGVTEAFKNRFLVFNDGSQAWLRDVIFHEFTHVVEFRVLNDGFWKSARLLKGFFYPLWLMEGLAEHSTQEMDQTTEEMYVRDAATREGGLISLVHLQNFGHLKPHQITLAYKQGAAAMDFLAREFGEEKPGQMLKLFRSRFEAGSVLQELVGMDLFEFDRKYREYLQDRYAHQLRTRSLQEPHAFGQAVTRPEGRIPEFNTSPVFSPDGRSLGYLSTRGGFPPQIYWVDTQTGRKKKVLGKSLSQVETIPLGGFFQISRNLSLSPDGRQLAFGGRKNHRDYLYLYDLHQERLSRISTGRVRSVSYPHFSADGTRIFFAGMTEVFSDLYELDLKTRRIRALTQDERDDRSPAVSPDGRTLVYSSEVSVPEDPEHPFQRDLFLLDLASGKSQRLTDLPLNEEDPSFSPDGRRVLFVSDRDGVRDLYELDLESRRILRLTRVLGGNFTPRYSPDGKKIAFSSFRHGGIHIYMGERERFLSEEAAQEAAMVSQVPPPPQVSMPGALGKREVPLQDLRAYRFQSSTDLFLPALFFSSEGGLFWSHYWQYSDMLGNHQTQTFLSYNSGSDFLSYQVGYLYARFRPQIFFGAAGRNVTDNLTSDGKFFNERVHEQFLGVAYPLDRFHRLEAAISSEFSLRRFKEPVDRVPSDARIAGAAFVRDTSDGRYLVVNSGSRLRVSFERAFTGLGGDRDYWTTLLQWQKFFPLSAMSSVAFRSIGGLSERADRQLFGLGGVRGLRGFSRSTVANAGSRFFLETLEYRFPLFANLDYYMWYIFPDFYFKAISAAVFTDAGFAWDDSSQFNRLRWGDINQSVGLGLRVHTFILQSFPFVLAFDWARQITGGGNIFYFTLGPTF